ncbi:TauD/TfdA family dioxygenase [Streptomyces sp. NPDC048550]|uniref:TauD/TfdA dioxygenase family protein n=1 Tax=unclassified Streptomyces TaxID=2593676 RepID=UPI000B16C817|nr:MULTISPECIES: TauD/TfdA family dioxygenase [unclassified Streptomyces]MCX5149833.1 TauD/TfdA family dioxygenase [Streptomyces sp. NBC_00320]WSN52866.1 TauD/TfdA family dioxygenase [Streptomyces sp. NBC_01296]WSW57628.1 TauD/TfdA family dioxygenase [Streptomyces sp. NBC_00998]
MHQRDLTPFIGVEYTGLTHAELSRPEVFEDLRDSLHRRDLVVVRGIDLTPEQQIELAARLGRPVPFLLADWRHPDFAEILVSSNERRAGRPVGIERVGHFWHQDSSFDADPSAYTVLHGVNVPQDCGHTVFASAADVYDRLPREWQTLLEGRVAVHTLTKQQRIAPEHVGLSIAEVRALVARQYPAVEHPVVRRDPHTGRRFLYAARAYTDRVTGLDANRNEEFFDLVDTLLADPDHTYTHQWTPHDLLLWKTATTYHVATDLPPGVSRTVHRVSVAAA